jgi:hypothetical protein
VVSKKFDLKTAFVGNTSFPIDNLVGTSWNFLKGRQHQHVVIRKANMCVLNFLLPSFCLDAKRSKKITAVEDFKDFLKGLSAYERINPR